MAKISPISGFPEWLPAERLFEERLMQRIREIAQSHGFMPIETPSVELIDTVGKKGVVDKELYVLRRAAATEEEEGNLALHFDLTVPFARYTVQHAAKLPFPFKRYQVQRVWRGDRPQRGRFREFYQFDFDIVSRDELPLAADAEVLTLLHKGLSEFNLGGHSLMVNSRRILLGLYEGLGVAEAQRAEVIRIVDKIQKISPAGVARELAAEVSLSAAVIARIVELAQIKFPLEQLSEKSKEFRMSNATLDAGVQELVSIVSMVPAACRANLIFDGSLARGLNYYTGLICEAHINSEPGYGSIGGGGRYENLAGAFGGQQLPGVGMSIGFTRLMALLVERGLAQGAKSPAQVFVTVYDEASRGRSIELAEQLRVAGINTEVALKPQKLGKQIEQAESRAIPFVVFIDSQSGAVNVKDLRSKEQVTVQDLVEWLKERIAMR